MNGMLRSTSLTLSSSLRVDDRQGRLGSTDALVLSLRDRLERFPDGPGAPLASQRIVLATPQGRVHGPYRVTPAFGRQGGQGEVAMRAVVADPDLVPGPRVALLRD